MTRRKTRYVPILLGAALVVLSMLAIAEYVEPPVEKLSKAIESADTIKIRTLDADQFEILRVGDSRFHDLQELLKDHELTREVQTMCHEPAWELYFRRKRGMALTATLCLKCNNLYFRDCFNRNLWVTILDPRSAPTELPRLAAFFGILESTTVDPNR